MKVKLNQDVDGVDGVLTAGTEIEHDDAYRLCELGVAEPLDAQAKERFKAFQDRQKQLTAAMRREAKRLLAEHEEAQKLEALRRQQEFAERLQ